MAPPSHSYDQNPPSVYGSHDGVHYQQPVPHANHYPYRQEHGHASYQPWYQQASSTAYQVAGHQHASHQSYTPLSNSAPAAPYDPNTYGPMPGASYPMINPMSAPQGFFQSAPITVPSIDPAHPGPQMGLLQQQNNTVHDTTLPGVSTSLPQHYYSPSDPAILTSGLTQPPQSQPVQLATGGLQWLRPQTQEAGETNQLASASPGVGQPSQQQDNVPPPLPPLPAGYREQVQKNMQAMPQHPPYSDRPPSHRYEPETKGASLLEHQSITGVHSSSLSPNQVAYGLRDSALPPPVPPRPRTSNDQTIAQSISLYSPPPKIEPVSANREGQANDKPKVYTPISTQVEVPESRLSKAQPEDIIGQSGLPNHRIRPDHSPGTHNEIFNEALKTEVQLPRHFGSLNPWSLDAESESPIPPPPIGPFREPVNGLSENQSPVKNELVVGDPDQSVMAESVQFDRPGGPLQASALGPGGPSDWELFESSTEPNVEAVSEARFSLDDPDQKGFVIAELPSHPVDEGPGQGDTHIQVDEGTQLRQLKMTDVKIPSPVEKEPDSSAEGHIGIHDTKSHFEDPVQVGIEHMRRSISTGDLVENSPKSFASPGLERDSLPIEQQHQKHEGIKIPLEVPFWYKESIFRYLSMIEDESRAASDIDRATIFSEFIRTEIGLRENRYKLRLPVVIPRLEAKDRDLPMPQDTRKEDTKEPSLKMGRPVVSVSTADTGSLAENVDETQYSPGGRPMLKFPAETSAKVATSRGDTVKKSISPRPENSVTLSPKGSAIDGESPISLSSGMETQGAHSYQPSNFDNRNTLDKAQEGDFSLPSGVSAPEPSHCDNLDIRRPSSASASPPEYQSVPFKPFRPLLLKETESANDVHSALSRHENDHKAGGRPSPSQDEPSPLSSMNQMSMASPGGVTQMELVVADQVNGTLGKDDTDPLSINLDLILSAPQMETRTEDPQLVKIEQALQDCDQSLRGLEHFYTEWERQAKSVREKLYIDRQRRREHSAEQIDAMFDNDEIGYGDIHNLEEEFEDEEMQKKFQEYIDEYNSYNTSVFQPTYDLLQQGIKHLMEHYVVCAGLLKESIAWEQALLDACAHQPLLTNVSRLILALHRSIESLHAKSLTAIRERDTRFAEVEKNRPESMGKSQTPNGVEDNFKASTQRTVLDAAKRKSDRSRRLFDLLERSIARGVSENQDYLNLIGHGIRKSKIDQHYKHISSRRNKSEELFQRVCAVVHSLRADSISLVQDLNAAQLEMTDAKFDLQIAEISFSAADETRMAELERQRGEQKQCLGTELDRQLSLLNEDHKKIIDEAQNILLVDPEKEPDTRTSSTIRHDADFDHARRMAKALEDAKRRNLNKTALDSI